MKIKILLVALLIFPIITQAQVNITRTQGTGYFLETQDGDTLNLRGATPFYNSYHTAYVDAIDYSSNNGIQVNVRSNIKDRVTAYLYNEDIYIEEVVDTVNVHVYSFQRADHNDLFKNVSWSLEIHKDSTRSISFVIETEETELDTLYTEIRCGSEWVENNMFVQPAAKLMYGIMWDCSSPLTYQFTATNVDGWEETITKSYPVWMSTYSGDQPTYSLLWGDMTWDIWNGILSMKLDQRNIARIKSELTPLHRNIRVEVTEVVDSTHTTGVHFALRTSEIPEEHSVETYLNQNGMGVSIFSNGTWSNPINFPVQWEYHVPITYTITLVDDTISVLANGETYTYQSELISSTPAGYLSMGSTGAGTYTINSIETTILE